MNRSRRPTKGRRHCNGSGAAQDALLMPCFHEFSAMLWFNRSEIFDDMLVLSPIHRQA
jgi:hypothetical protein